MSSVSAESSVRTPFSEEAVSNVEIVANMNANVHSMLRYGKGIGYAASANEVIAFGEGHCGDYTYLLMREISKLNFESRIVGVRSRYKNAAHSRLEVKIEGKWFTFDPTLNIYYPHSTQEMIDNPDLSEDIIGEPSFQSPYIDKAFFSSPKLIEYLYDADLRDKNIVTNSTIETQTTFYEGYGTDNLMDGIIATFSASNTYELPQSLTFILNDSSSFYRIKIKWYSPEISGKSFKIDYWDEGNKMHELIRETDYSDPEGDGVYEKVFSESITATKLKFTLLDAYEQSRLLIRDFMIFE